MADKKISALTASTTPLAGTEVLPIVQGGSTVKVSVANLTAGRTVTAAVLGVGTASPLTTFNVEGGTFLLRGGPMDIGPTSGANGAARISSSLTNAVEGKLIFSTSNSSSALTEAMNIDKDGNVTNTIGNLVIGTAGKGITNSTGSVALNFGASGVTLSAGTATMSAYGAGFAVFNSSGVISSTRNLASNTQTKSVAIGATQNLFYVNDYKLSASGFMTIRSSDASGVTIKTFVFNIMGNGIATGLVQLASEDYGGAASTFTVAETRNSPGAPNNQISLTNTSGVASTVEVSYQFISGYENVTFI